MLFGPTTPQCSALLKTRSLPKPENLRYCSVMRIALEIDTVLSESLLRLPRNLLYSLTLQDINAEKRITRLFSLTHPDLFFCPFVFNNSSGPICIFNIFFSSSLCFQYVIRFNLNPMNLLGLAPCFGAFAIMTLSH
jgi:hypothetical protein